MNLLLIETSPRLHTPLADEFRRAGISTEAVGSVESGFAAALRADPEVVVLDVEQAGPDWPLLVRRLRAAKVRSRILLITPRPSVAENVTGLNAGADDCVARPIDVDELIARVRVLLRSSLRTRQQVLIEDLVIDLEGRRVTRSGRSVALTAREFHLLECLARRAGEIVSARELEQHLYRLDELPGSNVIASAICILRKKLSGAGAPRDLVETRRGHGYRLRVAG